MVLQSIKSKVASGFTQLSGLVLVGGTFLVVIGCPYSVEIREAGFWFGGTLVAALTVYAAYQFITCFKTVLRQVRSQIYWLANLPGDVLRAINSFRLQLSSHATGNGPNLRLPPDIFFAREMVE